MVGAEMEKVYPVRLKKLKWASLWRALFNFHAEPDKPSPSRGANHVFDLSCFYTK